jgi:hypothetical protein
VALHSTLVSSYVRRMRTMDGAVPGCICTGYTGSASLTVVGSRCPTQFVNQGNEVEHTAESPPNSSSYTKFDSTPRCLPYANGLLRNSIPTGFPFPEHRN